MREPRAAQRTELPPTDRATLDRQPLLLPSLRFLISKNGGTGPQSSKNGHMLLPLGGRAQTASATVALRIETAFKASRDVTHRTCYVTDLITGSARTYA